MIDVAVEERAVLGSMLSGTAGLDAARSLTAADFYLDSHRVLFSRMLAMVEVGAPVDPLSLMTELMRAGQLDSIGGAEYLDALTDGIPRTADCGWSARFVKNVKREANRRSAVALLNACTERLQNGDENPDDVLSELVSGALASQGQSAEVKPVHISEWVVPTIAELERDRAVDRDILGIACGIPEFDKVTTGWRDGELAYVGAIPGRGKTAFLLQSVYAAAAEGIPVGIISLEMRSTQLMRRLAVLHSKVKARKVRDPRELSPSEWQHVKQSVYGLADLPIHATDMSGLRPAQIKSLCRMMHGRGCRLIVIDFIQIVQEEGKDRVEAINRVSAAIRDVCKELNIPFIVASQLARKGEDENRRPGLQDLKGSGNLEQDCHKAIFIFREKDKAGDWTGCDELIVAKCREGEDGPVMVTYNPQALLFESRQDAQASTVSITSGRAASQVWR